MSAGSVFKRCGCREPVVDADGAPVLDAAGKPKMRRLQASCPKLHRPGGGWSPKHGAWKFQTEFLIDGAREVVSQGGLATARAAEETLATVSALVYEAGRLGADVAERDRLRLAAIEVIRAALKAKLPLPSLDDVLRAAGRTRPLTGRVTVGEWLGSWLDGKRDIAPGTRRVYESHIRIYLIPHLGHIMLERLRVSDVRAMFEAITVEQRQIEADNAARRAAREEARRAWRDHDAVRARAARARLAGLPPFRKVPSVKTRLRVRGTLSSALGAAMAQQLIEANPAALVELERPRRMKPTVWTAPRVQYWKQTGQVPAPVMVWTPNQTVKFLQAAARGDMHALFHLAAATGMRRGEIAGLRWADVDLERRVATVAQQTVQLGWATAITKPKSETGDREVPLDAATVAVLRKHRAAQNSARAAAGAAWTDSGLAFTDAQGAGLHPDVISRRFTLLTRRAGLPPVRLHALRHGLATRALMVGVDMQVVSEILGHSSVSFTRDTYTAVFPDLKHEAVAKIAATLAAARVSI